MGDSPLPLVRPTSLSLPVLRGKEDEADERSHGIICSPSAPLVVYLTLLGSGLAPLGQAGWLLPSLGPYKGVCPELVVAAEAWQVPGDTPDWEEDTSWFEVGRLAGFSSADLLVGSSPVGSRMLRDNSINSAAASPSLLAASVLVPEPVKYKTFT